MATITSHSKQIRIGRKISFRISASRVMVYLFMLLLVAFMALPLLYIVSTAFKPTDELYYFPPRFFVQRPTVDNFANLARALSGLTVPFSRTVFNSLITAAASVLLTVLVSCGGAYGMVKHRLPFSNAIFALIIAALMFAPQVTQIPTYLIVSGLGFQNTYWAMIVTKIAVPFNFFLAKQFMEQMPDSFLEAGRLDGAGEWTLFTRIVMPFLKPAWATLVVFSFVSSWNDYFTPLVYIRSEQLKTLPLVLQTIGENGSIARAGAMGAATLLCTLPTILIFSLMQKRVIETMAYSGIK